MYTHKMVWKLIIQMPESKLHSNFTGKHLETLPSIASVSRGSSYESWVPYALPNVPKKLVIKDWIQTGSGTHGTVRKVLIEHAGVERYVCMKLFSEEWKPAFEREALAYAFLIHRGVQRCIPKVYWKGAFPIWRWNGDQPEASDTYGLESEEPAEIYYGLVMEYFDDFKELEFDCIDVSTAKAVAYALIRIHEARVMHEDLAERNILLVRQSGAIRVVLVDFSCSWVNVFPEVMEEHEWGGFLSVLEST